MARETRRNGSATPVIPPDTPSSKRKRQPSQDPMPSLKVILPGTNAILPAGSTSALPKVKLTLSPTKRNSALPEVPEGEADMADGQGVKRQKISLKVNGVPAAEPEPEAEAEGGKTSAEGEGGEVTVKEEKGVATEDALSKDVREALRVVIERMAMSLPKPLNVILSLWLPPTFEKVPSNTLGHILQRPDLRWEELVNLLHTLCQNLLGPCAYPSPFPSLANIHQPIPPLASHQPPHGIYDFCASLRDVMLACQSGGVPDGSARWALTMRGPTAKGEGAPKIGEWWTSVVDSRMTDDALRKIKAKEPEAEGDLLEILAGDGNRFGFASAVGIIATTDAVAARDAAPKLGESVVRKASLKAAQWKRALQRRQGRFGSVLKPISSKSTLDVPWTPSFGPTYDSNYAAGGMGYWGTVEAMHQRARYGAWTRYLKGKGQAGTDGYSGVLPPRLTEGMDVDADAADDDDDELKGERTVDEVLSETAEWIEELQGWQAARAFNGDATIGEREEILASAVRDALADLASSSAPKDLLSVPLRPGAAHALAKRLIPVHGAAYRGTLDPARPKAMHDNYTVRVKPLQAPASLSAAPGPASVQAPRTVHSTTSVPGASQGQGQGGMTIAQQLAGAPRSALPPAPAPSQGSPAPRYPYGAGPGGPGGASSTAYSGTGGFGTGSPNPPGGGYRPPVPAYGYGASPSPNPGSAGPGPGQYPYGRPPQPQGVPPSPSPRPPLGPGPGSGPGQGAPIFPQGYATPRAQVGGGQGPAPGAQGGSWGPQQSPGPGSPMQGYPRPGMPLPHQQQQQQQQQFGLGQQQFSPQPQGFGPAPGQYGPPQSFSPGAGPGMPLGMSQGQGQGMGMGQGMGQGMGNMGQMGPGAVMGQMGNMGGMGGMGGMSPGMGMGMGMGMSPGPGPGPGPGMGMGMGMPMGVGMGMPQGMGGQGMSPGMGSMSPQPLPQQQQQNYAHSPYLRPGMPPSGLRQSFGPA